MIDDLPVAEGLAEDPERGFEFDSVHGSIVTACAGGRVSTADVRRFYRRVLPALGWQPRGGGYGRDEERLAMSVESRGGLVTACFRLSAGPS